MSALPLVTRTPVHIRPDPARVVTQLFVPGHEVVGGSQDRASGVVTRVLALDESAVRWRLAEVLARFEHRHRDILTTFSHHADRVSNRLPLDADLSRERWLLLGATFTHESAFEAASICNPSIVAAPDQPSTPGAGLRFVLSVRGIGEGHRSSIGFRSGTLADDQTVTMDRPEPFPVAASVHPGLSEQDVSHGQTIATCSYRAQFPATSDLSERVLAPAMAAESHGLEDARFVRFVEDDGQATYYATYTAFDGIAVSQQLLQTHDFASFSASPMVGPAADNKGLALFPRRIGGRYMALSRCDRETNAVTVSDSLSHWDHATTVQFPHRDWEIIQLGNCGSPIETAAGWLVLTHGVGPMRTYSIGALLLDLDDPTRVIGSLPDPLLTPQGNEQDGYVPNVVYSCGALRHGNTIVLPYGVGDSSVAIATLPCDQLLRAMR